MNDNQRLQLQNMIKANNVEDQTDLIRQLKHSEVLRSEINNMLLIKSKYKDEPERMSAELVNECGFLFTYYTEIFNKVKKDEIDLGLLNTFIDILKQIENGELDQHEGSFKVGTILKNIYIDSALKKAEKLEEEHSGEIKAEPKKPELKISWKEFKKMKK